MELTPDKILKNFQNKAIDKNYAVEQLTALIDNCNDDDIRLQAIEKLQELGVENNEIFKVLENLFISDLDARIRCCAANFIKNRFINKAAALMKWAILHEKEYNCLITIIKTLVELNTRESKKILLKEVKKIKENKYLDENKKIENKKFKKAIKGLLADNKFEILTHDILADILINYITISKLTKKFYSVYFDLETYFVTKLDLADVEYEVRGWKSDFKNNIRSLSEITGLENLTHLTHLNLSNNQIKNIEDLIYLKNLTHLYVSNNQIKNITNLDFIKKIPHLKYIDLAGNQITDYITSKSLINIETNLRKYYH